MILKVTEATTAKEKQELLDNSWKLAERIDDYMQFRRSNYTEFDLEDLCDSTACDMLHHPDMNYDIDLVRENLQYKKKFHEENEHLG